jgi:hypothetical protein
MTKPNFIIVGAQKSGSTTLYYLLKQHPEIFLPDFKEPLYFISDIIKNISSEDIGFKNEGFSDKLIHSQKDYLNLFEPANGELMVGEASASYLYYHEHCIPKIKEELGDPKIIIILREPVSKIFSQYKHLQREHAENRSFEEGLELEKYRIDNNYTAMYHYRSQGLYYNQVKAYKDNFSNVLVVLTDDLYENPATVAKHCYSFLGVDHKFLPKIENFNVSSKVIKNRNVHKFLYNEKSHRLKMFFKYIFGSTFYNLNTKLYKKANIGKLNVKMKEETRKELKNYFKEDITSLEKLINLDLSKWKS